LSLSDYDQVAMIVEPIIDDIGDRCGKETLVQEIKSSCHNGKAFLFIAIDGFVVLKPLPDKGVLVWVAYCEGGNAFERYHESINELADVVSAQFLECWTVRKGMSRTLPKYGWSHHRNSEHYQIWRKYYAH